MNIRFISVWISALCICLFIVQVFVPGFTELFLLNESAFSEPWRFVTPIFLHGDISHVAYNVLALLLFGLVLEGLVGSKRFTLIFFVAGILANVVSVFFYPSSLGASGAIFGVIGALIALRPTLMVFAFGIPMPIILAGVLWAAGDIIGIFVPSNVANLAHLSGMAFGLLVGFMYRQPIQKTMRKNIAFDESSIRAWEERHLR